MNNRKIEIFDTTLRDGAQQRGVNFSIEDKEKIFNLLDEFGVDYIECGWPGAIPKDTQFFNQIAQNNNPKVVAFGATRKAEIKTEDDDQLNALLKSAAKTVCLVAKSDIIHIQNALKTTPEQNLQMVEDSIKAVKNNHQNAIVDAEHFFDGFRHDLNVAVGVVAKAFKSGARVVVLCDTNGGCLPDDITNIVSQTIKILKQKYDIKINESASDENCDSQYILGIHAHNDTGCAVANSIAAVKCGVAHVQGTINEYGERTGNANLLTVIANLEIKLGIKTVSNLQKSFGLAHNVAEIANININQRQPYIGDIAFAHKAGLHASAIKVNPDMYQHINPKLVGNDMKMVISEMAGKSSIALKVDELGFKDDITDRLINDLTNRIKKLEQQGYAYDLADASFELLVREILSKIPTFFKVESWRTISERRGPRGTEALSEATVKLEAGGNRIVSTGEGNGPVNALDAALRGAIENVYPQIKDFELTDYRVRLLDTSHGTDSITRVLITCYDQRNNKSWTTIGVGPNIVESSWEALTDCYIFGLINSR